MQAPIFWAKEVDQFKLAEGMMDLPAIAITVAVCLVLIMGIRATVIVNLIFVIIKVIILLIFIIAGSIYIDRKNYSPFFPPNRGMPIF